MFLIYNYGLNFSANSDGINLVDFVCKIDV